MKLRYKLVALFTVALFLFSTVMHVGTKSVVTAAGTDNAQLMAKASDEVIFAYVEDSPPISSVSETDYGKIVFSGYCDSLAEHLGTIYPNVIPVAVNYGGRFRGLEGAEVFGSNEDIAAKVNSGTYAIECGPNSKTRTRVSNLKEVNGQFSETFFTTSTKLLMKKSKVRKLEEDYLNFKIGVISSGEEPCPEDTTNQVVTTQVICNIYGSAQIIAVKDRSQAIEKLDKDKIDAYASDEILLKNIQKEEVKSWQYVIKPELDGLTREDYGIVLYNTTSVNTHSINEWIQGSGQAAKKNKIENPFRESWTLKLLAFLVSLHEVWILIGCLIFLLIGLFIVITHHWFIGLFRNIFPLNKILNRIKINDGRFGKVVNNYIKVVNNIFYHVDKDLPLKLVEMTLIQPRLKRLKGSTDFQPIGPENIAEFEQKQVCEELDQELADNNFLQELWKTALESASDQTKKRIAKLVGISVDRLWDLGMNRLGFN